MIKSFTKVHHSSMLMNCIRSFAKSTKFPGGSIGREGNLSNNFSFPKHKELFQQGYYNGDEDRPIDESDYFESPVSKKLREENFLYKKDAVEYGPNNTQEGFQIEGGIMQNYRKLTG